MNLVGSKVVVFANLPDLELVTTCIASLEQCSRELNILWNSVRWGSGVRARACVTSCLPKFSIGIADD